jgi:hypothetical protein
MAQLVAQYHHHGLYQGTGFSRASQQPFEWALAPENARK